MLRKFHLERTNESSFFSAQDDSLAPRPKTHSCARSDKVKNSYPCRKCSNSTEYQLLLRNLSRLKTFKNHPTFCGRWYTFVEFAHQTI